MNTNPVLTSATAKRLFKTYASGQPIIDYHNHLSEQELVDNKNYQSITQFWLAHDHYKWRAMRVAGVPERCVTGDAGDEEKFIAWAQTIETLVGSPLYAWTHLELSRLFGIDEPLSGDSAQRIYERCNEMLQQPGMRPLQMLQSFGAKTVCTTNDPFDTLSCHIELAKKQNDVRALPTFRPDKILRIDKPAWQNAVAQLSQSENTSIRNWDDLKAALVHSLKRFALAGCRAADHGFEHFTFVTPNEKAASDILTAALAGQVPTAEQSTLFWSTLLAFLAGLYHQKQMVMMLRTGVARDVNGNLHALLGNDAGGDNIGRPADSVSFALALNTLNNAGHLPRTILFSLNPNDLTMLTTLAASFANEGVPGYVQPGVPWWFNDTERGIRTYLDVVMEQGFLAPCAGMLTDSRSIGSFVRHEYFRQILCDHIGALLERGTYPDEERAGRIIQNICCNNAAQYFAFN